MPDIFDAVADPSRRELLSVLLDLYVAAESDAGEATVAELATALGEPEAAVTAHLDLLATHGLVREGQREGARMFSLDAAPLEQLEDWVIPFLSADFDPLADDDVDLVVEVEADAATVVDVALAEDDAGVNVFAAWAGASAASRAGRAAADTAHRARSALESASRRIPGRRSRG